MKYPQAAATAKPISPLQPLFHLGVEVDKDAMSRFFAGIEGKSLEEICAAGAEKLAKFGGGGGGKRRGEGFLGGRRETAGRHTPIQICCPIVGGIGGGGGGGSRPSGRIGQGVVFLSKHTEHFPTQHTLYKQTIQFLADWPRRRLETEPYYRWRRIPST